jgi:phage terminase small subunit
MPALKNAKHEAVAQAFIADKERIGWRAYKHAFPNSSRHASETAWSRLLKTAEFKARIAALQDAAAARAVELGVMSAQEVLRELSKIGRANVSDYVRVTSEGDPAIDLSKLSRDQAAGLVSVSVEDFTDGRGDDAREVKRVTIRLGDKRGALRDLGQHHKLFTERLEIDDKKGLADKLAAARRRAAGVRDGKARSR